MPKPLISISNNPGLPSIPTLAGLADWLLIPQKELSWFADLGGISARSDKQASRHYYQKWLPKKKGAPRLLEAPKTDLKEMQRKILSRILDKIPAHDCAHGFVRKRSVISSAQCHAGEDMVIAMDLREYFPRISPALVRAFFRSAGYPAPVASHLTGICTTRTPSYLFHDLPPHKRHSPEVQKLYARPHLPQGAPTSPALANLCTWPLDIRLAGLANRLDITYTRYADDLAFSGGQNLARHKKYFPALVGKICREEGFSPNHNKTRIMGQGQCQRLTGLVINSHVNIDRKQYDLLKAILHNCVKYGANSQNREQVACFRQHLEGRVIWVETVNLKKGHRLRQLLEKIKWDTAENRACHSRP